MLIEESAGSWVEIVRWRPRWLPPGGVVGEDAGHGGDEGVDDLVKLGQVAGGVEVAEPVKSCQGAGFVVGEVQAVQFVGCFPSGAQAGVVLEERVEPSAPGAVEAVGAPQQQEPRPAARCRQRRNHQSRPRTLNIAVRPAAVNDRGEASAIARVGSRTAGDPERAWPAPMADSNETVGLVWCSCLGYL